MKCMSGISNITDTLFYSVLSRIKKVPFKSCVHVFAQLRLNAFPMTFWGKKGGGGVVEIHHKVL